MLEYLNVLFRTLFPLWEMSVTAAYAAAVVIVLRLLLKKRAPKQVLCLLWLVVFARLLIPISPESPLSIVPNALPGQEYIAEQAPAGSGAGAGVENPAQNQSGNDTVANGIGNPNLAISVPEGVSPAGPAPEASAASPWQAVVAGVWLTGAAALGGYALVSWLRLRRRLFDAIRAKDGAWEHPAVDSPFILGVLRPRIYLPAGLTGRPRRFILCHERAHLRRFDHIVKPVCWIALALHWFNPLAWAAFLLMSRDIEAACDEAVVRQLGSKVKAGYSYTLLALAAGRRFPAPCPLAFGEGDARGRIRNVLNYRRPALWAIVISVIAAALAAVCLLTDPVAAKAEGGPDSDAAVSHDLDSDAAASRDPDSGAAVSHDPDAKTSQPPVDPADTRLDPWMKEILDGERTFSRIWYSGLLDDRAYSINDLFSFFYGDNPEFNFTVTPGKLAIMDLDRDGINELVIHPVNYPGSMESIIYQVGYLILRRVGDEVYGYAPGWRSCEYLKADGTFDWSSSAGNWGTASLSFDGSQLIYNNITWCATTYDEPGVVFTFVDGQEATPEEFEAAIAAQNAKPEPTWYAYEDGVLSVSNS